MSKHTDHTGNHDHPHDHSQEHGSGNTSKNALSMAFWLNFLFSIVEVAGGILTNSTAIIADAFHDFMDAGAIGIAILLEKLAGKKRTEQFSYGYKRFSLLSALGMAIFLLVGSVMMVVSAINSFIHPEKVDSAGMIWLAILGLAVNGFAFLRIKKGSGAHNHSHSHAGGGNHNTRGIMLHLLEDVLGWAAVLAGAAIMYFTSWYWIDGVLAIGIASFVGFNATRNLVSTVSVLLQSSPAGVDVKGLTDELQQIEGVTNVHDVHVWSLDGSYHVGSLHAVVNPDVSSSQDILRKVIKLMEKYKIHHPTVQIETDHSCGLAAC